MADNQDTMATNSDFFGTWKLEVKTPFGQHPATLTITPGDAGKAPVGDLQSQLGNVPLTDLRLDGNRLDAGVALDMQGRTYTAKLAAQADDGRVNGTIDVNFPLAPTVKFSGTKQ